MNATTPILAAFLSPALFYGGAAAVAAPILIHLLARRRFKRIRWAAMDFLIDAERRNRRRVRMEEWILLALRCLAVLLIAIMIGRPFLEPAGVASLLGGSRRTERIFLLDDSLSTAYQGPTGTVFGRVQTAVHRLIDTIRKESPGDTTTVIRMSDPTTPVDFGTYLDPTQTEELLARVDAMTPTQQAIDPATVIAGLVDVLERSPDVSHLAVYVIGDFQRNDWVGFEPGAAAGEGGSAIFDPLAAWAGDERRFDVVLVNVAEKDASNLALTDVAIRGGRLVAGTTGTVRATVANFGDANVANLEIELSVGNFAQPTKVLKELSAQQTATADLDAEFVRAGFDAVRVGLLPDNLPGDNVRFIAADVASAIRVLIVNGESSTDDYDNETTFLETALHPEGEVFSGNEVVVVDEAGFDEANLESFHAVVLANVYRISEPAVESLERFVRRGGGLLIFLGDQVDPDLYNVALYRDGEGILPARLTEVRRAPEASHLVVTDHLHPAMRGLSAEGDPLGIGQIPFHSYFSCRLENGASEDEVEAGTDRNASASSRGSALLVARFDDADQSPAIVERRFGQGRVVLLTSTADKEWHQWPDHPTFLPIMMELVRHVAKRSDTGASTFVGDTVAVPIDPAVFETDAYVRTPAYPNETEVGVTAVSETDGNGLALRWAHTAQVGLYQFVLTRRDGGEAIQMVAVNTDPNESDLSTASQAELRRAMGDVPYTYIEGLDQLAGAGGEARTELWRLALVVAFVLLMLEQALAWSWGRRR